MKFFTKRVHVVGLLVLLVLAVSALSLVDAVCLASGGDAPLLPTFDDADKALKRAFVTIRDAEAAGANVSGLLSELDLAGRNLTMAEMAYATGNISEAATMVDQCVASADSVVAEAANLKSQTVADARATSWRAISYSLVGVFVFLIVLVLAWVLFKRSYSARSLRARPEVAAR